MYNTMHVDVAGQVAEPDVVDQETLYSVSLGHGETVPTIHYLALTSCDTTLQHLQHTYMCYNV